MTLDVVTSRLDLGDRQAARHGKRSMYLMESKLVWGRLAMLDRGREARTRERICACSPSVATLMGWGLMSRPSASCTSSCRWPEAHTGTRNTMARGIPLLETQS